MMICDNIEDKARPFGYIIICMDNLLQWLLTKGYNKQSQKAEIPAGLGDDLAGVHSNSLIQKIHNQVQRNKAITNGLLIKHDLNHKLVFYLDFLYTDAILLFRAIFRLYDVFVCYFIIFVFLCGISSESL
ncbi:MAG: hypothetical protein V8Q27_01245 [Eubacteriales bacterium]